MHWEIERNINAHFHIVHKLVFYSVIYNGMGILFDLLLLI